MTASPRLEPLAQDHHVLYESSSPGQIFAYTPGIVRLASGRLLATMDQGGPGVADLDGHETTKHIGSAASSQAVLPSVSQS